MVGRASPEKKTSCYISKRAPPPIPGNSELLANSQVRRRPLPHELVKQKWPQAANPRQPYGRRSTVTLPRHDNGLLARSLNPMGVTAQYAAALALALIADSAARPSSR